MSIHIVNKKLNTMKLLVVVLNEYNRT